MISRNPRLLTPGPLALAPEVKASMQSDLGSRDSAFRQVTRDIRHWIQDLAHAGPDYTTILMQGSGTFAIEAALTTFLKDTDKVLVCANGVYGETAAKILRRHRLGHEVLTRPITEPVSVEQVAARLAANPQITHLYVVHCETTSGILNPLPELLALARSRGITSIVDSMSAFGAIEVDAARHPFDILISSGNKCLEAPPGIAFAIVRRALLTPEQTVARTYTLDLYDQWCGFEENGDWRSTPPTHVAQALRAGLMGLRQETVAGRHARYAAIRDRLIAGLRPLGFAPILRPEVQTPICVAFRNDALVPDALAFTEYYQHLRNARLLIYARFHEASRSFRIGCIGQIEAAWVDELIEATRSFALARRQGGGGAGLARRAAAAPERRP
ncbi:2-aminoethylphosphonate--pyruvate transaminase [Belnapia rosea]|uniref:2-aminoethylphosphonate--pyruvate transaminase n=1 Tax=Belnapia rosea TaxID=938405 RepID=A0A1G6QU32_9PROT|nr:2-aminoethylphosphonate--pyruvate transaminase [Belnapia rosea]SDB63289.1 2-aminoethylphosphonate-pyruvate transaminase [Belnapia rosea]SDC95858.1 2-aminoethylphosphonate-pyruvate transaminase [Belnapia rosea]